MTLLTLFLKLLLRIPLLEYQGLYSQSYLKKSLLPGKKKKRKKRMNIFRPIWTQSGEEGFSLQRCLLPPSSATGQTFSVLTASTAETQQESAA